MKRYRVRVRMVAVVEQIVYVTAKNDKDAEYSALCETNHRGWEYVDDFDSKGAYPAQTKILETME